MRPGKIWRDVGWGLLWVSVVNTLFAVAGALTIFAMYGPNSLAALETLVYDASAASSFPPVVSLPIALISVMPFMVTNAPMEESVYRGFVMNGISRKLGATAGVIISSLIFGAQHTFFAATTLAMPVFFIAFLSGARPPQSSSDHNNDSFPW